MQKAAAVLALLVAGVLAGCSEMSGISGAPRHITEADKRVQHTFNTLDRMKQEDLITADQHEQLRRVLVGKLTGGIPVGTDLEAFEWYIGGKYYNLQALHRLQTEGRMTADEYARSRDKVLDLPK